MRRFTFAAVLHRVFWARRLPPRRRIADSCRDSAAFNSTASTAASTGGNTSFGGVVGASLTPNIQVIGEAGRIGNVLPSARPTRCSPSARSVSVCPRGTARAASGSPAARRRFAPMRRRPPASPVLQSNLGGFEGSGRRCGRFRPSLSRPHGTNRDGRWRSDDRRRCRSSRISVIAIDACSPRAGWTRSPSAIRCTPTRCASVSACGSDSTGAVRARTTCGAPAVRTGNEIARVPPALRYIGSAPGVNVRRAILAAVMAMGLTGSPRRSSFGSAGLRAAGQRTSPYDGRFAFVRLKYTTAPGGFWYAGLPSWVHGYPDVGAESAQHHQRSDADR